MEKVGSGFDLKYLPSPAYTEVYDKLYAQYLSDGKLLTANR
jgi:hypothetical protein